MFGIGKQHALGLTADLVQDLGGVEAGGEQILRGADAGGVAGDLRGINADGGRQALIDAGDRNSTSTGFDGPTLAAIPTVVF